MSFVNPTEETKRAKGHEFIRAANECLRTLGESIPTCCASRNGSRYIPVVVLGVTFALTNIVSTHLNQLSHLQNNE
jgi:hypothetical protein